MRETQVPSETDVLQGIFFFSNQYETVISLVSVVLRKRISDTKDQIEYW